MFDKSLRYMLVGLLLLGFLLGSYEEYWQPGAYRVVKYEVHKTFSPDDTYIEIIWDASGSMWGEQENQDKIDISKDILNQLVVSFEDEVNLGLRVFGAKRPADKRDSFLAVKPLGRNKKNILGYITNIRPLGKSPINYSLIKAKEDLIKLPGNKKHILLITDCINNGDISLDDVIAQFVNEQIIISVINIGDTDNQQSKDLQRLVQLTGGQYYAENLDNDFREYLNFIK